LNAILPGPRFVIGLYRAGEPTYNAMLSFSYVISAYDLITGTPTQTNKIGSSACGGAALSYGGMTSGEAVAVYAGSPGGYASFPGTDGSYYEFVEISSGVSAATLTAHIRVRSGWTDADIMHVMLPVIASSQFQWIVLAGSSSQIQCIVYTASNAYSLLITTPPFNEWHTYACAYDTASDILAAYMDGSYVDMRTASTEISSSTPEANNYGFLSIAPEVGAHMDLKAAYFFISKKTAAEIQALHNMMILDGTPRTFPSWQFSEVDTRWRDAA
jgi:hypothetical protein